jgi:hypothetical protein
MTVGLNAAQARAKSQQDMIIYNEVNAIMLAVLSASANGVYEANVVDGSTMTESTPTATRIGTVNNPIIIPGDTLIINNQTIVLGATGTNLNAIVADINDANVPGVIASKDSDYLVLTITVSPSQTWQYEINSGGTATAKVGLTVGVYTVPNPTSVSYYNAWQGLTTDRAITEQISSVEKYFNNLGYRIQKLANPQTGKTFTWNLYW